MKNVPLMMKPGRPDTKHDQWAGCTAGIKCVPFDKCATRSECTCTYNDYRDNFFKHIDCPEHGEVAKVTTEEQSTRIALQSVGLANPDAPGYYKGEGMTPWDVWQAFDLDPWAANVIKYLCRAGKKDGESDLDDLKKARQYLNYMIKMREEG